MCFKVPDELAQPREVGRLATSHVNGVSLCLKLRVLLRSV
jgi:hypothetical protein